MHLSTNKRIAAMVFYSLITFFITPVITRPYFEDHPDPCIAGFLIGGVISICLWMKFSKDL